MTPVTLTKPFNFETTIKRSSTLNADEIQEKLVRAPYASVRKLNCEFHGNSLVLFGYVESYYCLQVAIAIVQESLPAGTRIVLDVDVIQNSADRD